MAEDSVSLKEYFTALMAEQRRAVDAALASQDKMTSAALAAANLATDKSEATAEKWRVNANEWRGAMDDREIKFVSVETHGAEMASMRKEIENLKEYVIGQKAGSAGMKNIWGIVAGGFGVLSMITTIVVGIIVIVSGNG